MFPKATDETLTQKLVKNCSAPQYFKATQGQGHSTTFTVLHYAGEVSCMNERTPFNQNQNESSSESSTMEKKMLCVFNFTNLITYSAFYFC